MEPKITYQYNSQYMPPPPPRPPRKSNGFMQIIGTLSMIVVSAIMFVLMLAGVNLNSLAMWPNNPMPWMFITSIFLHASLDHIFWNMFMLFMFGMALERIIKTRWFLALFLISGIVGNMGYVLFCHLTGSGIPAVGASGAIYGVLACLTLIVPNMRVYLLFAIPMKIYHVLAIYAALDLLFLSFNDNIAHAAHLAGLLVGIIFGLYLRDIYRPAPRVNYNPNPQNEPFGMKDPYGPY